MAPADWAGLLSLLRLLCMPCSRHAVLVLVIACASLCTLPSSCHQGSRKLAQAHTTTYPPDANPPTYRPIPRQPFFPDANQKVIGEGLKDFLAQGRRGELFITSKVWNDEHRPAHVR